MKQYTNTKRRAGQYGERHIINHEIRFAVMTIMFVLITAFFISGTVESRARGQLQIEEKYYDEMERTYVSEIKNRLEQYGMTDSGINMTYVSDDGEGRVYKVIIHNRQLKWMEEEKYRKLQAEIRAIEFPAENCVFFHEFVADKEL